MVLKNHRVLAIIIRRLIVYSFILFSIENREVLEKQSIVIDIGTNETIQCYLQNENDFIRWYDDTGDEFNSTPGGRIEVSGGTLSIRNAQSSDGGTYECRGLIYSRFYTAYVNGRSIICKIYLANSISKIVIIGIIVVIFILLILILFLPSTLLLPPSSSSCSCSFSSCSFSSFSTHTSWYAL